MGKKPLVSVVIPFLNGENFIREAVESVLTQTYDSWELWLVDDGSTDGSTRIAMRYAKKNPGRVFYLEHADHENRGVCASRNMAIRSARGEYIALLDVDDVWRSNKLERQVAILQSHPRAEMVFGMSQYWFSWTGIPEDLERDYIQSLGVRTDTLFEAAELLPLLYPLGNGSAPCPSDILMRRELIDEVGGFEEDFRGQYQLYEDQAFLVKVYNRAAVFVSGECWDLYRIHPTSCVSTVTMAGQYDRVRLFFLSWLESYLSEQQVKSCRVWAALQRAFLPYGRSISMERMADLDTREIKWSLRTAEDNVAELVFPPDDQEVLQITIEKAGTKTAYDIQLNQSRLKVRSTHGYSVHFRARADRGRSIFIGFAQAHEPWNNLGLYKEIALTSEWQSFQEDFTATADDDNTRIHFDAGGSDISVELSEVVLLSLPACLPVEPTFPSLGAGELQESKALLGDSHEHRQRQDMARRQAVTREVDTKALILMYHRVNQVRPDPWDLCVTPKHFAEHLDVLRADFHPMRLTELLEALDKGEIPNRSVVVTFDDGYADNLYEAKPLLERYIIPATIFLASGCIGSNREFWYDELERLLFHPGTLPETLVMEIIETSRQWDLGETAPWSGDNVLRHRAWKFDAPPLSRRHELFREIYQLLQSLPANEQWKALETMRVWANLRPEARKTHSVLSLQEVVELAQGKLVEIGSHTVTHSVLSALTIATQWDELERSKSDLEKVLNRPVTSFAYPYGENFVYTAETVRAVREFGFDSACTTTEGLVHKDSDRFLLPRVMVLDWDGETFARQLSTWFNGCK